MLFKKKSQQTHSQGQNQGQKFKKTMASLRLQKDLAQYKQEQISFVELSFPNQDSLQLIHVQITGQQNSIYSHCRVLFRLQFPESYPMDPPKLTCLNRLYHPNISYKGNVCLPLVRQDFSPTVTLTSIICGLIYILTYPNAQDALNPEIGDLMIKDYEMFRKIVQHTVQGRVFKNLEYDRVKVEKGEKGQEGKGDLGMKKMISEQTKSSKEVEKVQQAVEKLKKANINLEEK